MRSKYFRDFSMISSKYSDTNNVYRYHINPNDSTYVLMQWKITNISLLHVRYPLQSTCEFDSCILTPLSTLGVGLVWEGLACDAGLARSLQNKNKPQMTWRLSS